jgi:dCMP deaminase
MSQSKRPDWDDYFISICNAVRVRGDCRRRQVGSVIVYSNRIISTGYNGTNAGESGCLDGNCPRGLCPYSVVPAYYEYTNCIAIHAEVSAIDQAVRYGLTVLLEFATLYVSERPCTACQQAARAVGLPRILCPADGGGIEYIFL